MLNLNQDVNLEEVRKLLAEAPGVILEDNPAEQLYPLASRAAGKTEVFVGRHS